MNKQNQLAQLIVILVLIVTGCTFQGEPPAAFQLPTATANDETAETPQSTTPQTQTAVPEITLVVEPGQIQGTLNNLIGPGISITGKYRMTYHTTDNVVLEIDHNGCDTTTETNDEASTVVISWEQVSTFWQPSPEPGDNKEGLYEISLLPNNQVMIKLSNESC